MDKIKIDRINELAHKGKSKGLTPEEATEQKILRKEFISEIKSDLRAQLDNIEIVNDKIDE